MRFRFKTILAAFAFALLGCGGSNIKNASHVRFFNAFTGTGDVRVYVGTRLLSGANAGPAFGYGGDFGYAQAPSGSVDITVNPYIDPSTVYASLATQTLVKDRNYTVIGMTLSGTRTLVLYSDNLTQTSNTDYFRIVDASPTLSPVYVTLRRASDDVIVYQTSSTAPLAVGGSTGYKGFGTGGTDSETYILNVYDSSDFSNSLSGDVNVTLQPGGPVTMVLYDKTTGGVGVKMGVDLFGGL